MRFLLTLGYVTSALALATQTAKFTERSDVIALESAAQSTHGENALALRGRTKTALENSIEKRGGFTLSTKIPFDDPSPRQIAIGGVALTFVMAHKWYQEGSNVVTRFVCQSIVVVNSGRKTVRVNVIAAGQFLLRNYMVDAGNNHQIDVAYKAPAGQTCWVDVEDNF